MDNVANMIPHSMSVDEFEKIVLQLVTLKDVANLFLNKAFTHPLFNAVMTSTCSTEDRMKKILEAVNIKIVQTLLIDLQSSFEDMTRNNVKDLEFKGDKQLNGNIATLTENQLDLIFSHNNYLKKLSHGYTEISVLLGIKKLINLNNRHVNLDEHQLKIYLSMFFYSFIFLLLKHKHDVTLLHSY